MFVNIKILSQFYFKCSLRLGCFDWLLWLGGVGTITTHNTVNDPS